jgi:hypothetical protein
MLCASSSGSARGRLPVPVSSSERQSRIATNQSRTIVLDSWYGPVAAPARPGYLSCVVCTKQEFRKQGLPVARAPGTAPIRSRSHSSQAADTRPTQNRHRPPVGPRTRILIRRHHIRVPVWRHPPVEVMPVSVGSCNPPGYLAAPDLGWLIQSTGARTADKAFGCAIASRSRHLLRPESNTGYRDGPQPPPRDVLRFRALPVVSYGPQAPARPPRATTRRGRGMDHHTPSRELLRACHWTME